MAKDLYGVLGVARDADDASIKKAFRKLAMKYHPDKSPGKANEQRFKEVNQAHEVLSDTKKRALYDEFGEESLSQGFDPERARRHPAVRRRPAGAGGAGRGRRDRRRGDLRRRRRTGRPRRPLRRSLQPDARRARRAARGARAGRGELGHHRLRVRGQGHDARAPARRRGGDRARPARRPRGQPPAHPRPGRRGPRRRPAPATCCSRSTSRRTPSSSARATTSTWTSP